jgi:glycerol uptake facilitator-like aquaporin
MHADAMSLARSFVAEALGTALLLAIVVGSGIMGARLAGGNVAIALLANSIATGAGLVVLILVFGPVSGAQLNPAVTLAAWLHGGMGGRTAAFHVVAQLAGAILGVWTAHAMFGEPILQLSTKLRDGPAQGLSELLATFGLIGTIAGVQRSRPELTAVAVGLYVTAAYWFTASTAFANPAVTIARSLTDSFAGIAPASVPLFVAAEIAGAGLAVAVFGWLLKEEVPA